jgi:hypothetical protein
MKRHLLYRSVISRSLGLLTLNAFCLAGFVRAETILVESRKADNTTNTPAWTILSGNWGRSKNKSKMPDAGFSATNVFVCVSTNPTPAFRVTPPGIKVGTTYKVEVTAGTSGSQPASSDLVVAIRTAGVANSTIPATTTAFQEASANQWTALGNITPTTNQPTLTFTYVSGTLSTNPPSRWYADSVRFVAEGGKVETKPEAKK